MIAAAEFLKWLEVFNVNSGSGTGTVSPGLINELGVYAANGDVISGLPTANKGLLLTSATGEPSIGNDILADISVNDVYFGRGSADISTAICIGDSGGPSMTGADNILIGHALTGSAVTSGTGNISIGNDALTLLSTGSNNVAVGFSAFESSNGSNNLALGSFALGSSTGGNANVAIGSLAGLANAAGAVSLVTGTHNTFIGSEASSNSASTIGTIAIGRSAVATISTGGGSGNDGPGIAIGAASFKVGFRGNGTIFPSAGTSAGYWRVRINGTFYKLLLMSDA